MNTLPIASLKQDVLIDDRKHNHLLLFSGTLTDQKIQSGKKYSQSVKLTFSRALNMKNVLANCFYFF